MMERKAVQHVTGSILTGHFREGPGYRAFRAAGTDDWLLVYTVAGRGKFEVDAGALVVEAGDAILIRPGVRHAYGIVENATRKEKASWELLWAHFHPSEGWLELLAWPEVGTGIYRLRVNEPAMRTRVRQRLRAMDALATGSNGRRDAQARNALEDVLLQLDAINPARADARIDPRIKTAIERIHRHLDRKITIPWLAKESGLSVSRLCHLFKEQVGATPQQFAERQRMERAQRLLAGTGYSVKQIAYQLGFAEPFYFSLRFKRATGQSPRAWRAAH
jgi:AraC family transcriptional regulator of arabinose operon